MNKNEDRPDKERRSFSDSVELFDTIFTRIRKLEKEQPGLEKGSTKKGKAPGERPAAKGGEDRDRVPGGRLGSPETLRRSIPKGLSRETVRQSTRLEARVSGEKKADAVKKKAVSRGKPVKMVNPLRIVLFLVLLTVLVGGALHFSGAFDLGTLLGLRPSKRVVTVKIPLKTEEGVRPGKAEKGPVSVARPAPKGGEKKEIPAPPPPSEVKPSVSVDKGDTIRAVPIESETKPVTEEPVSPQDPLGVNAGKGEQRPAEKAPDFSLSSVSYPYSIYLGSYRALERVGKAVSTYREVGLSPYWLRMDLGEKGIWFRLFAGHFKTRAEADALITSKKIPGAESRHTRYALLVGAFASAEERNTRTARLVELGYSPYAIAEEGVFRLYVGAFFQKTRAEKQQEDLASRGVETRLVQR